MKKDIDLELYNRYLNGEKEAFEILYKKYKDKIQYFIFNIIKDYQKAEDITQETFIYVLQHKVRQGCSFKYYIYLIAKSRALNYKKMITRRIEIHDQYIAEDLQEVERDISEIIIKEEENKLLVEAINMLDDKYKNAIYLVKVEELSYKEVANILGETENNIKNLIHRGKKELRKILIKKGFDSMSKFSKILLIILCTTLLLSGIVYAITKINENLEKKVELTPTFTGKLGNTDNNSMWIGTFNLAWNELMDNYINGKIEFDTGNSIMADELNKQLFTANNLSESDYYIKVGQTLPDLKETIKVDIKNKFEIENSEFLDNINFENASNKSFTIYALLFKQFDFKVPFDRVNDDKFGDNEELVKYFGINNASDKELTENAEVIFYDSKDEFAIRLLTNQNDEILLYRTDQNKSFNQYYESLKQKEEGYTGAKKLDDKDEVKIPYIDIDTIINYDELCGKFIKGTDSMYIQNALQNVKFSLNEKGGHLLSEAGIKGEYNSALMGNERTFYFDNNFVLFLKEKNKDKPYMALKVDNINILQKSQNS